jgi:hypothetical protein
MVTNLKDIKAVIIPHFLKYPLITQKQADFYLFKAIVEMLLNKEHLSEKGLREIVSLSSAMNLGKSEALISAFPDIKPAARPKVEDQLIKDPNWLAGFVSAEGCFFCSIKI